MPSTTKLLLFLIKIGQVNHLRNGSGYFTSNDILSLKAILLSDIWDWSILMTYGINVIFGRF